MFTFIVVMGMLLFSFGGLTIITAIPATSWDSSWAEIKEAFSIMFRTRRFQVGAVCLVIGLLMIMSLIMSF